MYLVGHIRKKPCFADGTKLFFQPDEEVIDARAAYCHFEVGSLLGHDAESATRLLDDAFYRFHGDDAAARNLEESIRIQFFVHYV